MGKGQLDFMEQVADNAIWGYDGNDIIDGDNDDDLLRDLRRRYQEQR